MDSPRCSYCELPIPSALWPPSAAAKFRYCCFGCRFADSVANSRAEDGAVAGTLTRLGVAVFFSLNVMVFTMALWTQETYTFEGRDGPLAQTVYGLFRYLCLLFSLPVFYLLGGAILQNAWDDLRRGVLSMDFLILMGVAASFLYSAVSVFRDAGRVYFEVGCMVLLFVTLGRWLEATAKLKASRAIGSLQKLLPATARLIVNDHAGRICNPSNNQRVGRICNPPNNQDVGRICNPSDSTERNIPLEEIQVADRLRILPGERIPCDGVVLYHPATVNEQILTGESEPVVKEAGEAVLGGSLNGDSELRIEVTSSVEKSTLSRWIDLIKTAQAEKGRYARMADRAAAWFIPAVMLIAAGAFVFHLVTAGLGEAILVSLAVVLIACPCALGIATPLAVWSAMAAAARNQVIFHDGEALEKLARVRAVCFDKTGTLTTGVSAVADTIVARDSERERAMYWAATLARGSGHELSAAICDFLQSGWARVSRPRRSTLGGVTRPAPIKVIAAPSPTRQIRSLPGRGVVAHDQQLGDVVLGSALWMRELSLRFPDRICAAATAADGRSLSCLAWAGEVRALFVFQQQIRPEAATTIADMQARGIDVSVLTGDRQARGRQLAAQLSVTVRSELLPEDKVDCLKTIRREVGTVAMVGDGVNDGPALAASDIGIAMGCGADVSRATASVCLLGNDLARLPWAIDLARRTVQTIRVNLFWAFLYNCAGIALACFGVLNPIFAAAAMAGSSLFVVANSLRPARGPALSTPTFSAPLQEQPRAALSGGSP